jgi:hypothetical protein
MSNSYDYDYAEISVPYNQLLERGGENIGVGAEDISTEGKPASVSDANVLTGSSFNDLWIDSWIKSRSYKPKSQGFLIDGRLGYIECMQLYVGSGGIVGGSLDIPNGTSDDSWHVDSSGNMWSGCNVADFTANNDNANAYILNTGVAKFQNITIDGGANVTFISDTLDTSSKKILKDFIFGSADYSGAFKTGDITWNTTTGAITGGSGSLFNKNGLVFATAGVPTITLNGITGAIDSFSLTAGTITGVTITGALIRSSSSGARIELTNGGIFTAHNATQDVVQINATSSNHYYFGYAAGSVKAIQLFAASSTTANILDIQALNTTGKAIYIDGVGSAGDILMSIDGIENIGLYLENINDSAKPVFQVAGVDLDKTSVLISNNNYGDVTEENTAIVEIIEDVSGLPPLKLKGLSTTCLMVDADTNNISHIRFLNGPTTPDNLVEGDMWYDHSSSQFKYYNGVAIRAITSENP